MSHSERAPLLSPSPSSSSPVKHETTSSLGRLRAHLRQPLAELLGVFLIVLVGDGVVAQYVLSRGTHGSWLGLNIAWAGGVMLASLAAGDVSGAHCNPAVSICLALFPRGPIGARFPARKLPLYILFQMIGGFLGAAVVYGQYWNQIDIFEGGQRTLATAGIFATYPLPTSTTATSFFSEFVASALLMLGIFAITSRRNELSAKHSSHFAVFVLIVCIGSSCGWQTGYAINAARDLAPRIFTSLIYGRQVFTAANGYWWIPVLAPICGTISGALIWETLVGEPESVLEGVTGGVPAGGQYGDEEEGVGGRVSI